MFKPLLAVLLLAAIVLSQPHVVTRNDAEDALKDGKFFSATHLFTGLANNDSAEVFIKTGAKICHLQYAVHGFGDYLLYLYETATAPDSGTGMSELGWNRPSSYSPTLRAFYACSTTANGTLLSTVYVPGDTGSQVYGNTYETDAEIILKTSTNYLIHAVNKSGATMLYQDFDLTWYEE